MSLLKQDLAKQAADIKNNTLSSYYPIRTEGNEFDWDTVLGYVVKITYSQAQVPPKLEEFKASCKQRFLTKLDEEAFWPILEQMYFAGEALFKIAPEFLLFKTQKLKGNSANSRLGNLFISLLQGFVFEDKPKTNLNFLETQLFEELQAGLKPGRADKQLNEAAYLPFLSELFQQDLQFLSRRPKYMLTVFKDFLRLYGQLYTAQLALNLKDWRSGTPIVKRNYFILDSEKASNERSMLKSHGYKQLHNALWNVFPYLSMNENLQIPKQKVQPIWALAQGIADNDGNTPLLHDYALAFKENRKLFDTDLPTPVDPLAALDNLFELAVVQFSREHSAKHARNTGYVRAAESEMCAHFIQSRGRAGRVLVINQDYLILLTNLAIGEQERLRLHELIKAFEARGIFFDKQSQQVLVEFYERIGNVERMSDSGDAVYVCKTI